MSVNLKNRVLSFLLMTVFILTFVFSAVQLCAEEDNALEIKANNAIIFNADSGYELYTRNADDYVYCAFLPRLMTCILLVEAGVCLETQVTITSEILKTHLKKALPILRSVMLFHSETL